MKRITLLYKPGHYEEQAILKLIYYDQNKASSQTKESSFHNSNTDTSQTAEKKTEPHKELTGFVLLYKPGYYEEQEILRKLYPKNNTTADSYKQTAQNTEPHNEPHNKTANQSVVTDLDDGVFRIENRVLKKYSGTESTVIVPEGVQKIEDYVFSGFDQIRKIVLPSTLGILGHHTFYRCVNLTEIIIPEGITMIPRAAFEACESLKSLIIPDSVNVVGDYAFSGCKSLETIHLPKKLRVIGEGAFKSCKRMKYINIPVGIKHIRSYAFEKCYRLKDIYYLGTNDQWNDVVKLYSSLPAGIRIHCN